MSGHLLDTYPANSTVYAIFDTFGANGESITLTGLAVTDIEIFKNGSVTQRASDAGYALLDTDGIDFDARTGIHGISIDLSDNTDASFYAVGSQYTVVIDAVTINGQTVRFVLGTFRIVAAEAIAGKPKVDVDAWLGTAAATPTVAGVPKVDLTHIAGSAVSTTTAQLGVNVVQAGGTAWGSGAITAAALASNCLTDTKIATDAITAAKIAASALNGKGDWNIGKTGYALSTAGVQAIWDALTSALTTVGSVGKLLVDNVNATIASRSSHSAADVWASVTRTLTAGTNIALAKGTGVTGFNDLSAAQVNAEVVDALNVDTYAEPGQGAPAATASLAAKINYLYKAWRNKKTQTATQFSLYADDALTVDQKATVSDDGTTTTVGEIATGP